MEKIDYGGGDRNTRIGPKRCCTRRVRRQPAARALAALSHLAVALCAALAETLAALATSRHFDV